MSSIPFDTLRVYLSIGWPLMPVNRRTKRPITPHGCKDATTDPGVVADWHRQYPGCGWAVGTSASLGAIDIDPRHGGDITLAKIIAGHGPLPQTWTARSGGDGTHHYFLFPAGTSSRNDLYPGIDRKADGGYVIIPPSRIEVPHHTGPYRWEVRPWDGVGLAEAPSWSCVTPSKVVKKTPAPTEDDGWTVQAAGADLLTHPGATARAQGGEGRRPTLCRLVGLHLARRDSPSTVMAMAEAWAERCTPPLDDWATHCGHLIVKEQRKAEGRRLTTNSLPPPASQDVIAVGGLDDEEKVGSDAGSSVVDASSSSPPLSADDDGWTVRAETPTSSPPPPNVVAECVEEKGLSTDKSASPPWPSLHPDAYYGLLGSMLEAVSPETEADPVGILLPWLACFGSVVGRSAWLTVGADLHYPSLYVGVVGRTSDAKGVGWGVAVWPFAEADPAWASACLCHGVSSGQGLVDRVRDERRTTKADRNGVMQEHVVPAAPDKRCLLRLDELAVCFKLQASDKSTLGETLLTAWGGAAMETPNTSQGENYRKASGYTVSIVGDTQPGTLGKLLAGERVEGVNGWMNRFLWCAVRGGSDIPRPKPIGKILRPYIDPLRDALTFAVGVGEVGFDAEAVRIWDGVYGELRRSGDKIPHTDRARPQVLRLALVYALADRSGVIRADHLRAALAVWNYCRASAAMIFAGGIGVECRPEALTTAVLNALPATGTIERWRLNERFRRRAAAGEVGDALAELESQGAAACSRASTGGRAAERWGRAAADEEVARSERPTVDNLHLPLTSNPADGVGRGVGDEEEVPPTAPAMSSSSSADGNEGREGQRVEGGCQPPPNAAVGWVRSDVEIVEVTDADTATADDDFLRSSATANDPERGIIHGGEAGPPLDVDFLGDGGPLDVSGIIIPGVRVHVAGYDQPGKVIAVYSQLAPTPDIIRVSVPGVGAVDVPRTDVERHSEI